MVFGPVQYCCTYFKPGKNLSHIELKEEKVDVKFCNTSITKNTKSTSSFLRNKETRNSRLFINKNEIEDFGGEFLKSKIEEHLNAKKLDWIDMGEGKMYSNYGDGSCRRSKYVKRFYKIFKDWVVLAKEHNIKYFLTDGTLLGAWRNGDFIPRDRDLDIVIDMNEMPKLIKLQYREPFDGADRTRSYLRVQIDWKLPAAMRRRIDCKNRVVRRHMHACTFAHSFGRLISGSVHMDIFGSITSYETVHVINEKKTEFMKRDVYPLRRCMFMGLESFCPQNSFKVLSQLYNDLMPLKVCNNKKWRSAR